jgi:precorrin-2 dehydrogenase/sirohydrochlorin ferrochelatase
MRYYPLYVNLNGKPAVMVGAGPIAERKVGTLLECGAEVTVIAPSATEGLRAMAAEGRVTWIQRAYQDGDLAGAFCTYAATNDNAVNTAIFAEAERNNQLCCVVDVQPLCNFIVPSIVKRGDLSIAISTSGNSPALAKKLRIDLTEQFGPEWEELNDLLGRLRPEVKRRYPEEAPRNDVLARMMDAGVLDLIREGRVTEAEEVAWNCI